MSARWAPDGKGWIRWAADPDPCDERKVICFDHRQVPSSHHGHRRSSYNRYIWRGDNLPRRVREAIGYP